MRAPVAATRTLVAHHLEVLHEPPVRLLRPSSRFLFQPVLRRSGEDPYRVAVADAALRAGGELEDPDLLADEGGLANA